MSIAHILILTAFICLGGLGLASIQSAFVSIYRSFMGNKQQPKKTFSLQQNTAVCTVRK